VFGDWQLAAQIDRVLGEASLLQKFSDEILECCQFAAECRRNADETDDLSRKQFWLDMEGSLAPFGPQPCIPRTNFNFNAATRKSLRRT
jgi:hypothetical protein